MINIRAKHAMLRLDLLRSHSVNQFPEKNLFKYPCLENCPSKFVFNEFSNKIVIERDLKSNILWFEKSFFEKIKFCYKYSGLIDEEDYVIDDLYNNFFQINENIGEYNFNPYEFGNGMHIKVAYEYAILFWNNNVIE